ncbi:girdin isoform 1, partial [Reticulomyxa filosa]
MSLQNADGATNAQSTKGNELPGDESEVPNSPTGTFVHLDNHEKFPSKLLITEEDAIDRERKKRNSTDSNASLVPRNDMYDTEILTNTNNKKFSFFVISLFSHCKTEFIQKKKKNVMLLSNLTQIQDSVCELFAEGDKDKDGKQKTHTKKKRGREEFFQVMQKILPESTYAELDELFDRLDIKKAGGIDYEQLLHSTEGGTFLKVQTFVVVFVLLSTLGLEDDNTSVAAMSPRRLVNFTSFNVHSGGKHHNHHHARNYSNSSVVIKQSTPVNALKKRDSLESHDSLVIDPEYDNMNVSHHPKDLQLIQQLKLQIEGLREENKTLKGLEKEVRDLKEEMDIFKSSHQRFEYEFDDLKKEVCVFFASKKKKHNFTNICLSCLETTQAERNDLQQQNERLELHYKQLKHELEDVTDQAPNEEERLEQITKLETTVVELRRNTEILSEQEKSTKNEVTTQQKYIETLEFKNAQLQEQVIAIETRLSEQNDTSEGLQVELRRTQDFLHKRMRSAMHLKREVIELQNELETQSPLNSESGQPQKPKQETETIRLRVKHISGKLSQEALKLAKESK